MREFIDKIKRNWIMITTMFVVFILCSILILKNINNEDFFQAGIVDIVTILLGAIITFFLTEKLTDRRRKNDCIEHVINEIEIFVSDDRNFRVDKSTYMKQASCGNRIKYLKEASFKEIQDDMNFIETHFSEIRDLYSNHNKDEETLESVRVDINKHRDCILDKCCKIRIGLYK